MPKELTLEAALMRLAEVTRESNYHLGVYDACYDGAFELLDDCDVDPEDLEEFSRAIMPWLDRLHNGSMALAHALLNQAEVSRLLMELITPPPGESEHN